METSQSKPAAEDAAERAAIWASIACVIGMPFVAWGLYALVFLGLLLGKMEWLGNHLLPPLRQILLLCGAIIVPLCLLMALFRKARLASGIGFVIVSGIFTFATSSFCAVFVYSVWSWWGLVLGTALVGYGILPVAALAAGAHREWWVIGQIASGGLMMSVCLYFGLILIMLALPQRSGRQPKMPSDIDV